VDDAGWLRTVGVEEEFLLVDVDGRPRPMSEQVLAESRDDSSPGAEAGHELHQQQVETGTRPLVDLTALRADLVGRRRALAGSAQRQDVRIAALGTSPLPVDPIATVDPRYQRMMGDYGLTAQEQLTCGCHVHVGIESRADGVAAITAIRPWLSVILALSANSPFWQGEDTGYASYRRMVWDRWPGSGPTAGFADPQEYDATVTALLRSGVLLDDGMVYFDARLSSRYPTVEVRVADVCPDPDDAVLIAALCRALVDQAIADRTTADRTIAVGRWPDVRVELLRGAAWRAARSGLDGDLVDAVTGIAVPAPVRVQQLVDLIEPALRRHGDLDAVESSLQRLLDRGTGATRQRAAYARQGELADVVADLAQVTVSV
jgi:glutamate---cysteine ligase / carboxylate-amine ligase